MSRLRPDAIEYRKQLGHTRAGRTGGTVAFIEQIGDSELFERDRAALGYVPNYTRLFAHLPASTRRGSS
jgi:hypothetical protein